MKRAFLIFILAGFLTACGGGGGNTPTVQMPDNPPMQTDDGENDNPQMGDMQTDNGGNDNPQMQNMQTDDSETMTPPQNPSPPIADEFDTPEFRQNTRLSLVNPLPAYRISVFGEGVTVVVADSGFGSALTHEDLAENVISVDIDHLPSINDPQGQAGRFDIKFRHGTSSLGVLGAVRGNGKGAHGVAPSVKMIPLQPDGGRGPEVWEWAVAQKIPIWTQSGGDAGISREHTIADITMSVSIIKRAGWLSSVVADGDMQLTRAAGNAGLINPNASHAYWPLVEKNLEDNILIVVNLNDDNSKNKHSDTCGIAKLWCVGTISGRGHYTTGNRHNADYIPYYAGTSAATPVVAGALALLKSFRPELKMTVIRQVLLESARPLGTRKNDGMPDEVFGWGAVDVGNGIATLQAMQTANGMAYSDLRKSLPSEFSHLRGRFSEVSVALRITDRSYYNMRLSDIVGGDSDSHSASLGNAAKEMQADDSLSPENSGFGFNYANGDYDLHYAGGGGENAFRFSGGLRHDDSQSSYIGEGSSPFAAENASDTSGYVKWTTADYAGLSAFGEYGRTQIKADYDSNSFVSKINNARAEEWTAGFQYRDLFLHNDNLQFSARQESRISGGEMILHYPVADGDSHKAFIGESVQTIRTETAKIPIKQKPQTIYTAGYSQKTENSKWSAAAEWNTATNAKGVSFAVELQIR